MISSTLNSNVEALWIIRREFSEGSSSDTFTEKRDFALELSGTEFVDTCRGALGPTLVRSDHPGEHSILADDRRLLVQVTTGGAGYGPDVGRHNFSVYATGPRADVLAFFEALRGRYGEARLATVTWFYSGEHGAQWRTVPMEPPLPIRDEFYPWLNEGVEAYIDRFLGDRAAVLFLMGPPGTGKTSLLRHMIYTRHLAATITYDNALIGSDEMFVNFLCDPTPGVLVLEDADLLVSSRADDGNGLISRFLNVSDGLIKTSGKKVVFTTNLGDFRRVDEALIRSGRCFDAVRFRALTASEARIAALSAGVPQPEGGCSLAELFSGRPAALDLARVGIR